MDNALLVSVIPGFAVLMVLLDANSDGVWRVGDVVEKQPYPASRIGAAGRDLGKAEVLRIIANTFNCRGGYLPQARNGPGGCSTVRQYALAVAPGEGESGGAQVAGV